MFTVSRRHAESLLTSSEIANYRNTSEGRRATKLLGEIEEAEEMMFLTREEITTIRSFLQVRRQSPISLIHTFWPL